MKQVDRACRTITEGRLIVFEENKRRICFINRHQRRYIKVKVDGCAITQGVRCDNLLLSEDEQEERYVELKGAAIVHAIEQLEATIQTLGEYDRNRHSYVICSKVMPKYRTDMQKWAKKFKEYYNSELVIQTTNHEVDLDRRVR